MSISSDSSNPAGTPGYRNGTESFFGLKGRPSVVRDVKIYNQPASNFSAIFRTKTFKNLNATGLETRKGDG
jgi:hypothetical protein